MPNTISMRGTFDVELHGYAGGDEVVCQAARVSTLGTDALETTESQGLINFLTKNRHGSPFEHGLMTFRITAPIMVWREFMRHRVGFSYNEQSGRYMTMLPIFYVPSPERPLVQKGKAGAYDFVKGTVEQYELVVQEHADSFQQSWNSYQKMLNAGIAKEVARDVLPLSTYSSAYVSCNPRSMMHFLSLRTKHEDSVFLSYPQWEINWVADQMEEIFKELWPMTHKAFHQNGRVAP